jgi:hypothetical protein
MSADLIACLPAEAVYRRVELPEEENAFGPWWRAIARVRAPDQGYLDRIFGTLAEPDPEGADPPGPTDQEIADFLNEQQETLELIHRGLARGRLQIPPWTSHEGEYHFTLFGSLGQLFCIARWAANHRLEAGDPQRAVEESIALLRLGSMVCNGEGILTQHLVGSSLRNVALDQLHRLALDDRVGCDLLRQMLAAVEQCRGWPDGLLQSLRVELCLWALPVVSKLPECRDVESFVDELVVAHYQSELMLPEEESQRVVTDDRLIRRREQILYLLWDHPAPFDRCDTARLMGQELIELCCSIRSPWRPADRRPRFRSQDRRLRRCLNWWPSQLTPWFPVDWLGDGAVRLLEEWAAEGIDTERERHWLPPTDAQLALARERLSRIHNPVGILMAQTYGLTLEPVSQRIRRRANLEGVRAVLALRVFQARHGQLPRTLAELLEAGILRDAPLDPFGGQPLHYDPARAILWSIGEDGQDNGGNDDVPCPAKGRDIVWRLTIDEET